MHGLTRIHLKSAAELTEAGCHSCATIAKLGNKCTWITTYVIPDGTICIYTAPSEKDIQCHADESGFGAEAIWECVPASPPTPADRHRPPHIIALTSRSHSNRRCVGLSLRWTGSRP